MDENKMTININWDELETDDPSTSTERKHPKKEKAPTTHEQEKEDEEKKKRLRKKENLSESIRELEIEDLNLKHSANEAKIMIEIKYRKTEKNQKPPLNKQILSFLEFIE